MALVLDRRPTTREFSCSSYKKEAGTKQIRSKSKQQVQPKVEPTTFHQQK